MSASAVTLLLISYLFQGLLVENQPPTTSLEFSLQSPVGIKRFGDSDVSKDIPEQPSPVSVLEQTFADSDQTVALDGTQHGRICN